MKEKQDNHMPRKEAAQQIYELQQSMEEHGYAYSTVYRRIFLDRDTGNWRLIGRGYDYTAGHNTIFSL